MKRVSIYLKLRVVGAVDSVLGSTTVSRIKEVAQRTFFDEDGVPYVFTWRTIQTWVSLYRQGGTEALRNRPRSDKGKHHKVSPEDLREAIETVLPEFRDNTYNKMAVYRRCIERGVLSVSECSQTSFFRLVRTYELLKPPTETSNKRRLAFSKANSNEMWQLDTMFGPFVTNGNTKTQAKLIAFIDDAHLMHIDCLRKLRLGINDDIRSRITYSVHLKPLAPDDIQAFILDQLDACGLPHAVFTDDALALVVRTSEGVLRRIRNLSVGSLLETVRDRKREVGLEQVNRVLMQPHWRKEHDANAQ